MKSCPCCGVEHEQPKPVRNEHIPIWDMVINDMEEVGFDTMEPGLIPAMRARDQKGLDRYGVRLQPHNGREVLTDLLDEILDGIAYAKQAHVEGKDTLVIYLNLVKLAVDV